MTPSATYRVQLNAEFGFEDAAAIVPYLSDLGVTHLYCSPYLQAVPGSRHGYDVADPTRLSEELGGANGHETLVRALRDSGLGQILDIVPNHMAADPANPWWWDVLEHGISSEWAGHFDIDWTGPDEQSGLRVLVPILGDHYGRVLERGELRVERIGSHFQLTYHEHRVPISMPTLRGVLSAAAHSAGSRSLAAVAESLDESGPDVRDQAPVTNLDVLLAEEPRVAAAIDGELRKLNSDPDRLDEVLGSQNYRLAHWRVANEEIDYRRFFNIESLVGVRVEDPAVFASTHGLILELVRQGKVSGLRIDHIDGLRQPMTYLRTLSAATDDAYLVVEKILEPGESLPQSWPVAGTTGYDFLDRVNQLFVESRHEDEFNAIYRSFTGETADYPKVVLRAKREIMNLDLAAEIHRLTGLLGLICSNHRRHRDHTWRDLRAALTELVAAYEVYRTYVEPGGVAGAIDRERVARAVAAAARRHADPELIAFLGQLATGDQRETETEREFTQRLQQVTAPVMAKGVEDTAFYRFNRLVSLNEVGGDPGTFGRSVEDFVMATAASGRDWPDTLLALTTHDTKRSADVRARINVLSEIPLPWRLAVEMWATGNETHRTDGWPDPNTEYLLYQTLVGTWPIESQRVVEYMVKATREARIHTSWLDPDPSYERATTSFVQAILDDQRFVAAFESFLTENRLVERGRRNSLAQVALALTVPGVPDTYQGDELWNLSLVDPDNRRPVEFTRHLRALSTVGSGIADLGRDEIGVNKLQVLHTLLQHRRGTPAGSGHFEPIEVTGPAAREVVAFRRKDTMTIVAVRSAPDLNGTIELPSTGSVDVVTRADHRGGPRPLQEVMRGRPLAVLAERRP